MIDKMKPSAVTPPMIATTARPSPFRTLHSRSVGMPLLAGVLSMAWLTTGNLQAEPEYTAKSGKIAFSVGSNIPLLKVAGSSNAVSGQGEGTVNGSTATVLNLRFEVEPTTFKTGMRIRDQHLHEKVFSASDGSIPKMILRADRFQAMLNAKTSKWEGPLKARLTMRGVTKPVCFNASVEMKGETAIVSASGTVKISDFGVKTISYSGAKVHDEVSVTVSDVVMKPSK